MISAVFIKKYEVLKITNFFVLLTRQWRVELHLDLGCGGDFGGDVVVVVRLA